MSTILDRFMNCRFVSRYCASLDSKTLAIPLYMGHGFPVQPSRVRLLFTFIPDALGYAVQTLLGWAGHWVGQSKMYWRLRMCQSDWQSGVGNSNSEMSLLQHTSRYKFA